MNKKLKMYREIDKLIKKEKSIIPRINHGEFDLVREQLEISKRFFELYEIEKIPKRVNLHNK